MKEIWKPVKDDKVQDRYAVSNLGREFVLDNTQAKHS